MQSINFNPEEFSYLRELASRETAALQKNIDNKYNVELNNDMLTLNKKVINKLTTVLRAGAYSVSYGGEFEEVAALEAAKAKKVLGPTDPITLEDEEEEE